MELELGLKITKTLDDTVSADFRLAKDRAGPVFLSTETDSSFILTAHLKGFKRENVKISIKQDGTQITISGAKPVQELVMTGRGMYKKEPEMRQFMKKFAIPEGIVLNQIKAKFIEEESVLKIYMPKLNKGIRGTSVEEVKEELPAPEAGPEESDDANPMGTSQREDDSKEHEIKKDAATVEGNDPEEEAPQAKLKHSERGGTVDTEKPPSKNLKTQEAETAGDNTSAGIGGREIQSTADYIDEAKEEHEKQEKRADEETVSKKHTEKESKLFSPCFFMGSALIASIVVLVVSFIRSKQR